MMQGLPVWRGRGVHLYRDIWSHPLYIVAMDVSAGVGKFDTSQTKPLIAPLKESMILMMASLQTPSCIAAAHLSLIQNRNCVH